MIRFENVGKRYGMGAEVLSDISFTLEPGSLHVLTGPSGAGKSTLLRLLYLDQRPTRGSVQMFGHDVTRLARRQLPAFRRRIGVVFQDFQLLDHMSALDNVALPLRIAGDLPEERIQGFVRELLSWVGLGDRLNAKPPTLSGGEQQRVAIARAVIGKPDLLLADEPTGNVDPSMAQRLTRLFVELNRLGTTTVIATHDLTLAESIGGARMQLAHGQLLAVGGGGGAPRVAGAPVPPQPADFGGF
ncbi:cell division transport system ATP-binding protein [Rhodothalassium salexigens DSM 2132]|uniref:Cell division ATP-binding protein FtsE n=1 Tax=Rhodothalassium salexigens DSM 2132 TaxID=1188247 RepID=A0A4R2PQT8_RHOSA|nr:cell division ATP-binding protein FtsE [Rhodothalassium salexigens]MBB4210877.1 cell division transport system ATP-binding protein [Rhodothalassium salexigens DSM 2132]TCP36465.1 cell division transport system ATP-binding protein [Rhodothalassium salexigens DSM 2132]